MFLIAKSAKGTANCYILYKYINIYIYIFQKVTVQITQSFPVRMIRGLRNANEASMDVQRDASWDVLQGEWHASQIAPEHKKETPTVLASLKMEQKHSFKFDESSGCFQNFENCLMYNAWAQSQKLQAEQRAATYHAANYLSTCHQNNIAWWVQPLLQRFCL